jgi:pectate lyase
MKLAVAFLCLIGAALLNADGPSDAPAPPAGGGGLQLRAFPGAEGFGAYTPGGRGGKVYLVTTLEDYHHKNEPPLRGSLRWAILAKEPRTVLFAVSGTIRLKERLRVESPFITIAGQSAPGDGICLADQGTTVATHDVIIRHVRFRHGDASGDDSDSLWFRNAQNVIVDHCSISWGLDENFSFTKSTANVTAQWCIISEGLNPKHHGYGSLIAPDADCRMSFHHNLCADNFGRNPRAGSRAKVDFLFDYRNNVVFNWGTGYDWGVWAVYGKEEVENIDMNFVGNYAIAGLDTSIEATRAKGFSPRFELTTEGYRRAALSSNRKTSRIYQSGNKIDSNVNGKLDGEDTGWNMVNGVYTRMNAPFPIPAAFAATTEPVDEAYEHVLAAAGAFPWRRDAADCRVVQGVRTQTGRIINSQSEVGGWPELKSAPAPLDTDGDGIPDEWEKAHGLDPKDPHDAASLAPDGSGYSNLEIYLNSLIPSASSTP